MFVILTIALVCILTASLVSLEDNPTLAQSSKKSRRKRDEETPRTFKFTGSDLTISKAGFPPDRPVFDLNGFRIKWAEDKEKNGWKEVNKYCSQKVTCKAAPHLLHLEGSNPPCSAFKEIFDLLRECDEKKVEKVHNWKNCHDLMLDHGFWRSVYKVEFEGRTLVIKATKGKHTHKPNNLLRHIREAKVLQLLKGNPYVVNSEAHCLNVDTHEFALITLFYPKGNLKWFVESGKLAELSVDELLDWSTQLARGVEAIHEVEGGPFVHADLQLRQVMIADDMSLKLNDFNRGKWIFRDEEGEACAYCGSKSKGKWRAPEEYSRGLLDEKLDIYSLGMMLYCLWNNVYAPYSRYSSEEVYELVPKGLRPTLPAHAPKGVQRVIKSCWKDDKAERPSARWVANELESLRSTLPAEVLSRPFIDCEFDLIAPPQTEFRPKTRKSRRKKKPRF